MPSPVGEPRGSSINPSPSGTRSGNFSSRNFTTPTKQSDHPQTPSRAPNDLNNLLKAFTQYTNSVVATSQLHFQRNLQKEKAERQQNLKDRWSKHYHSFIALAEDHDRVSEKAGTLVESLENQMKYTDEAQEAAVRTLMSSMMASSAAANPKTEEYSSLKEEIWNLKDGLRATQAELDATKYDKKRTKGFILEQDVDNKLRTMSEYEKQMAELTVVHNKLLASVNNHEKLMVLVPDIQTRVHKLNASQVVYTELKDKLKEALIAGKEQKIDCQSLHDEQALQKTSIQGLLKDFAAQKSDFKQISEGQKHKMDASVEDFALQRENLTQSIAVQDQKIETLVGEFAAQKAQVESLNMELVGDLDPNSAKQSKGLIDYIAEGTQKNDKFEGALRRFDTELESFQEKLGKLENGMHMLESRPPIQDSTSTQEADRASHNLDPGSVERIPSLEGQVKANHVESDERISHLERQAKAVEEQQEMKDDFVAVEVERLDNLLITQEKALQTLQEDLSALKSQVSSAPANKPPTPPPQIEIQREPDESFRLQVEELETTLRQFKESSTERVDNMEILVDSQQQRFDNLSTEHLAKNIIHQMQILYPPHPANLQAKFDHIKAKQTNVEQHLHGIGTTIKGLGESMTNQTARMDQLQGRAFAGLERQCMDVTSRFSEMYEETERRYSELDAYVRNQHQHGLESRERRFTDPPSDTQAGFERKLGEFKKVSSDRFQVLESKHNELKQNSSIRFTDVERNHSELVKKVTSDQLDWRLLCHNLENDCLRQATALQTLRDSIVMWKTDNASKIATFEDAVKTTQTRLDDVEATTTKEIASFHGSLSTLKKHVSFPQSQSPVVQDLDSDTPLAQKNTLTKTLRKTTGPTAEKLGIQEIQEAPGKPERPERQERHEKQQRQGTPERQERQSRQRTKRKKGTSPSDMSESSDSEPVRPVRKSNRSLHLTEKKLNTTLRGHSRSGGEHRS